MDDYERRMHAERWKMANADIDRLKLRMARLEQRLRWAPLVTMAATVSAYAVVKWIQRFL